MLKYKLIIGLFFVFTSGYAQMNLIVNGDFEDTVACPTNLFQIYNAYSWYSASASPDYFNSCNTSLVGVPNNFGGFQNARSGEGYAGVAVYHPFSQNVREYIAAKLFQPLVAGKKYCLSFYVSPAGGCKFSIDAIGGFLSSDSIFSQCPSCIINTNAQVNNAILITDTIGWSKISGYFVAVGGESYIAIGNFSNDAQTTTTIINTQGQPVAYFYIDDISLYEVTDPIAGNDTSICMSDSLQIGTSALPWVQYNWQPSIGLSDSTISNPIAKPVVTTTYTLTISDTAIRECTCDSVATITITVDDCSVPESFFIPNLLYADQLFSISGLLPESRLTIYNALGQRVYFSENYGNNLSSTLLAAGCYIFDLQQPGKELQSGKFCVVH